MDVAFAIHTNQQRHPYSHAFIGKTMLRRTFRHLPLRRAFHDFPEQPWPWALSRLEGSRDQGMRFIPRWDVTEDQEKLSFAMEIPGMDKDKVKVDVHDDMLTVSGEKQKEERHEGERSWHVERSYGSFTRSFKLPTSAKLEEVTASYDQGVLNVTVPKSEPRNNKRSIKVS